MITKQAGLPVNQSWQVFTDGAIRARQELVGLAAVVKDLRGEVVCWWTRCDKMQTCNEAEYAAAILALEMMKTAHPKSITLYSDSQILVSQMNGAANVNSDRLRILNLRLRGLAGQFQAVRFLHIPRSRNRLADALAYEAVEGY